jgi:CHAT domain-containing protein
MQMAGLLGDREADLTARLIASRSLYDAYVRPLASDLAGIKTLLLVPSGPLACLPFEALVSGTRQADRAQPLSWAEAAVAADQYAMEYVPSLTMMAIAAAKARRSQVEPSATLLAVGDVAFGQSVQIGDEDIRFVLVPARSGADNELLALPHTAEEVQALAQAIAPRPATILSGTEATEERVRQELDNYAILHFATHGLIADERDPLSSALLLSPGADGKAGLLTARDVYETQLPARLAVLSACDTASGRMRFVSGGVTSLAGAFLYAGVPNVVASLWPVDDLATSKFMESFYQTAVAHPGMESEALRSARQALRTQEGGRWADPYYWSAFLLFR